MEALFAHVREEIFRRSPHDEAGVIEHSGADAARGGGAGRLEAGADGRLERGGFEGLSIHGRFEMGIVDGGFKVLGVAEMEPGVHLDFDVHHKCLSADDAGDRKAVRRC